MLCQICGNQNYTLKITRIKDGVAEELKVCEDCAIQISPYHAKLAKKNQHKQQAVENLLKDLLAQKELGGGEAAAHAGPDLTCQNCGLEFLRYKQTLMLGCPECYDNFGEKLLSDIQRIHNATEHVGGRATSQQNKLLDLQAQVRAIRMDLDESLEREDYARAAALRDQLRKLQELEVGAADEGQSTP